MNSSSNQNVSQSSNKARDEKSARGSNRSASGAGSKTSASAPSNGSGTKSSASNSSNGSSSKSSASNASNGSGKSLGAENRGFASMDPEKQREIASMGGKAAHESGNAHEFDSKQAREAGRKSHDNHPKSGARAANGR